MEEDDDTELIEEFKKTGQLPLVWQWTSREFVCAANILRDQHELRQKEPARVPEAESLWKLIGPMMLLYGLALENVLKGLLVAQGVDATSTGELNRKLKTHNLLWLWKQADLPNNGAREEVLENLHWSIEAGKYPVGTKPDIDAPAPVWVALTNVDEILNLLHIAEDALRGVQPNRAFEKTNLLSLCRR